MPKKTKKKDRGQISKELKRGLVALTYIKCTDEGAELFEIEFNKNPYQPWETNDKKKHPGTVLPLMLGTVVGYFDFVLITISSSVYLVTEYCMKVLRSQKGQYGNYITDTQSSIAVISDNIEELKDVITNK
ncbi:MAG: hypothetical protein GY839_02050 [candidate division Zixibacteria bacterium]|nr:hypothetical protein [candidate division Zixibacteria bacterium]